MAAPDLVSEEMNRLRGRLCGLIESWGVPDKQERGMINTLKSLTYDAEKAIKESISE
jgi:hypothetical protein